ncbi:hypothetical protein JXA12_03210 [Candidatus Woesearchaeota archaeon]|nr:hypothetical protein [Candidatus Woesearchaeota archaeon]
MGNHQAQSSIGVLILFISALFVAAIGAGVFIQTNNEFQAKTTTTGDQARKDVSSAFFTMDISASDGEDGDVEYFKHIIKIPPGTEAIDLNYVTLLFSTQNDTATLTYHGEGSTTDLGSDGYNTWTTQEAGELGDYYDQLDQASPILDGDPPVALDIDLDYDDVADTVVVCDSGFSHCPSAYDGDYLQFSLSTAGIIYVRFIDINGQPMDISVKNGQRFGNYLTPIDDYGYVTITGNENDAPIANTILGESIHIYHQPLLLDEDLDDDGSDDSLVINDTHVILHYSSKGDISSQLNNTAGVAYSIGQDLSTGGQAIQATIELQDNDSSIVFGEIDIDGTTTRASYIDADVTFTIVPGQLNKGYYAISYVQRSPDYQEGVISDGDVVRLYYEAPRSIGEDEEINIMLVPRNGVPTHHQFFMPNIIKSENVHVYP